MSESSRRVFMMRVAAGGTALASAMVSAAPKRVEESEPKAMSLGYRHDSAQVDKAKYPKHTPDQKCNNCVAWLGKPSDPTAECDLITDRLVSNGGWCSSYVKKKG
jgi:hypothetical protein